MPYKAFNEDDQYMVYKVDEGGKQTGKPLGTHKDQASASKQIKALMANETKEADHQKMSYDEMYSVGPTSFTELEQLREAQEASEYLQEMSYHFPVMAKRIMSRDDIEDKDAALGKLAAEFIDYASGILKKETESEDKAVWSTAFVNNLPDSSFLFIEKDCGEKDDEGKIKPRTCRHFPYKDASGKVDLPHLRNAIARIPQSKAKGLNKEALQEKARKLLADTQKEANDTGWFDKLVTMVKEAIIPPKQELKIEHPQPYSYIWKDDTGQYRWLAAYTNNFRDNDNPPEIISSAAHKDFDKAVNSGEWPMPEVWLWHYPYPVGQTHTHYYDEKSGFCIAGGVFTKEWAAEGIIKNNWQGISHGMPKSTVKRDEKDQSIITSRRTREITFLPTNRAANQLAFHIISKELEMNENKEIPAHKRQEFVDAFGEERVEQMETEVAQRSQQAKEEKTESKETAKEEGESTELQPEIATALQALVTAVNQVNETVKGIDDRVKELEKSDKEKIAKEASGIPQASVADLVKSQLFSTQNQVKDGRPAGPTEKENNQDGSSGLFFEELGWTSPVGRQ